MNICVEENKFKKEDSLILNEVSVTTLQYMYFQYQ